MINTESAKWDEEMLKFSEYLQESVSTVKKDVFLRYMSKVYDKGDERLIKRYLDTAAVIQVEDIIKATFAEKLPKAESGADKTLTNKIVSLGLRGPDQVNLANAILSGSAYDIPSMLKAARKSPVKIDSFVGSVAGAKELLPWYVDWRAKADASTRGTAASEIWLISAGKNGRTPSKGDAIVNGVAVESKSSNGGFDGEFSISGKQSSFKEPTAKFKSGLSAVFKKHKISVEESEYGLGSARKSNSLNGKDGKSMIESLQRTVDVLVEAKVSLKSIDSILGGLVVDSFPSAKGLSFSVLNGNKIDAQAFMTLWNAAAFAEYKAEEGFDVMLMIDRKASLALTFYEPKDILDVSSRLKHKNISYEVGIGQNKSIGGFGFK